LPRCFSELATPVNRQRFVPGCPALIRLHHCCDTQSQRMDSTTGKSFRSKSCTFVHGIAAMHSKTKNKAVVHTGAGAVPICSTKTKQLCTASGQTIRLDGVCSMVRDAQMRTGAQCLTVRDIADSGESSAARLESRLSRRSNSMPRTIRWKNRVSHERGICTIDLACPNLCLERLGYECRVYRRCHYCN
jgi:hypothetical protein